MPRGKKVPTKAELIQLQKLYKTDERIAERLGVTPYLVAYWRRKKNIPRHLFPKFSEADIREVWERYGDDHDCGVELGISKAAFYNWRRKYGLKEKPAFLKLEQLELPLQGASRNPGWNHNYGHQTISQKIIARLAGVEMAEVGQLYEVEPDLAISHDNVSAVIERFKELGQGYVWNPNRIIVALNQGDASDMEDSAVAHKSIRDFARRQNIKNFFDVFEGSCHQVIAEKGKVLPGQLAVGNDQYSLSYGSLGAYTATVGASEMAQIWCTGRVKLQVPESIKVVLVGKLPRGVFARDLLLFVAKNLTKGGAQRKAVEFYGSSLSTMSISERFTLSNQAAITEAVAVICPFDSVTRRYFLGRTKVTYRPSLADKDAHYSDSYEFDVAHLTPQATSLERGGETVPISQIEGLQIQQVVIGSCANGRFDDLRLAADIMKGKKIHPDVRMLIFPSSKAVYLEALKKGLVRAFVEAGALVMNPGCGACKGSLQGTLAPGERGLSTANLGFGNSAVKPRGEIYLVSPATAAASAIKGHITDPSGYMK